ncbi:unnamed protein product [Dimorphilus gyrociliatus]|uniref:RING-type domain-containing protein n=1 Tax=Dimorphilus gyrociliatus TaxID=2664684 RepID=A0A7I8VEN5_9ANNE|nr:unnamed protein product [Dimorphilus gyrociliatus]
MSDSEIMNANENCDSCKKSLSGKNVKSLDCKHVLCSSCLGENEDSDCPICIDDDKSSDDLSRHSLTDFPKDIDEISVKQCFKHFKEESNPILFCKTCSTKLQCVECLNSHTRSTCNVISYEPVEEARQDCEKTIAKLRSTDCDLKAELLEDLKNHKERCFTELENKFSIMEKKIKSFFKKRENTFSNLIQDIDELYSNRKSLNSNLCLLSTERMSFSLEPMLDVKYAIKIHAGFGAKARTPKKLTLVRELSRVHDFPVGLCNNAMYTIKKQKRDTFLNYYSFSNLDIQETRMTADAGEFVITSNYVFIRQKSSYTLSMSKNPFPHPKPRLEFAKIGQSIDSLYSATEKCLGEYFILCSNREGKLCFFENNNLKWTLESNFDVYDSCISHAGFPVIITDNDNKSSLIVFDRYTGNVLKAFEFQTFANIWSLPSNGFLLRLFDTTKRSDKISLHFMDETFEMKLLANADIQNLITSANSNELIIKARSDKRMKLFRL